MKAFVSGPCDIQHISGHYKDVFFRFCHCSETLVEEGDLVRTGTPLALVGNTGNVTGKNGGYHLCTGATRVTNNKGFPVFWQRGETISFSMNPSYIYNFGKYALCPSLNGHHLLLPSPVGIIKPHHNFGDPRSWGAHDGIDIPAPEGLEIKVPCDSVVVAVRSSGAWGLRVYTKGL
jgi:murein DD-endopeptidase MepM/ murein hydrolase activator NlpD